MKKIICITVLSAILCTLIVKVNAEYTSIVKYYYIGKCDRVEFEVRFLDGKPRGRITLLSPLSEPYNQADENYKVQGDKITYTFEKPIMGKWNIELYAVDMNNAEIKVYKHNLQGSFDEQHDVPITTSRQEHQMRAIYMTLDTFEEIQIKNINNKFTDITASHWASPYVAKLNHVGIIAGYGDKTFKPEKEIKTAELIKLVTCAMGYDIRQAVEGYWAKPYIDKAIELRLIEEGEYASYEGAIRREQAARIMVRAAGIKESLPDNNLIVKVHEDIPDYNEISDYYKTEAAASYAIGIITGIDGYFRPKEGLTRAQASTVIMRYIDDTMRKPYVPVSLRNARTMDIQDGYGKQVTVYPPKHEIVMDAAYKLDKARRLTIGASTMEYQGDRIQANFYSNNDDKAVHYGHIDIHSLSKLANADMFIELRLNDVYSNIICYLVIYNYNDMNDYHNDVLIEMFKFWFEGEFKKIQNEFAMIIEDNKNGKSGTKEFICNQRTIEISYDGIIGIRIYER